MASVSPLASPVPLVGRHVRLDPLVAGDAPSLFDALDDARVYALGYLGGPLGRPASVDDLRRRLVDPALAEASIGRRQAYVVRLLDGDGAPGRVIGTSSLGDIETAAERIHLGWTAYAPPVWGGVVNPECKLLLLGHCFDDLGFGRVKIQTDLINTHSQAAIVKLGGVREGVLRRHSVRADGSLRDTVVYSVLADEWPQVRAGLLERRDAAAGQPL